MRWTWAVCASIVAISSYVNPAPLSSENPLFCMSMVSSTIIFMAFDKKSFAACPSCKYGERQRSAALVSHWMTCLNRCFLTSKSTASWSSVLISFPSLCLRTLRLSRSRTSSSQSLAMPFSTSTAPFTRPNCSNISASLIRIPNTSLPNGFILLLAASSNARV